MFKQPSLEWIAKVQSSRPHIEILIRSLQRYHASVEIDDGSSMNVASIEYVATFALNQQAKVTVYLTFMDWQSSSDVVITNMTTLPQHQKGKGFGREAIAKVRRWARDNDLNEIRATQIDSEIEAFWQKCGFKKDPVPNNFNDHIFVLK